ncbi:MAG: ABC transporter permease [Chloroflexota bacterium]
MQRNTIQQRFYRPLERQITLGRPSIRRYVGLLALVLILVVWQVIASLRLYPSFIIPPPGAVLEKFITVVQDGRLWLHTSTTLVEVLGGLALGVSAGVVLGYIIAKNQIIEDLLSPVIVALQSTPVVAYAPLLVIWFGSGPNSKVLTCALTVFFPMLMNTVVGIRNTPAPLRDLMRSLGATRAQMLTRLEIPAALPVLLNGLKVSATLSVIGAVVGEFIWANAGLGFLINLSRNQYDTPLVIVAVLTLALMARALYSAVSYIERRALAWQQRTRRD